MTASFKIIDECQKLFSHDLRGLFLEPSHRSHALEISSRPDKPHAPAWSEVNGILTPGPSPPTTRTLLPSAHADTLSALPHSPPQTHLLSPPSSLDPSTPRPQQITSYIELWDETSGTTVRFQGFIAPRNHHLSRSLFLFFDSAIVATKLRSSTLMALLEFATSPRIECAQVVLCLDRRDRGQGRHAERLHEQVKALGFIGFEAVDCLRREWGEEGVGADVDDDGVGVGSERYAYLSIDV